MTDNKTMYWHDYETFGTDPMRDRPAQFAGIRTDEELNIIGQPLSLFCKPADDLLPQPDACLVTGITPRVALEKGLPEAEFITAVHRELALSGTCGVGYNSIRFDDEITRYALYRNFFDPYAREWRNGNSRWDLIDTVRLTGALRPEGIEWPAHKDGTPSFRLEDLTAANGIPHGGAHDALADVRATIALARLIRERQPRLYAYIYRQRDKHSVVQKLNLAAMWPVLHVSAMYPREHGCAAMVVPVAMHPVNKNGIIVYDLRHDPAPLLDLDAEGIRERLFTATDKLPDGVERIPLKVVHINKCPVIVPLNTLDEGSADRLRIDIPAGRRNLDKLQKAGPVAGKVQAAFTPRDFADDGDPDHGLYSGGFFSDADKARMEEARSSSPAELAGLEPSFQDPRLPEMLFRYRARNYPGTLSEDEKGRWEEYRLARLTQPDGGGSITLPEYREKIQSLREGQGLSEKQREILCQLEEYADAIIP